MAKKRKQPKKDYTSPIKWNDYNQARLKKAVNQFNSRVDSLRKHRKDTSYIPSKVGVSRVKKQIATEEGLEEVIRSLGRFKGTQAYKQVTLPSGEKITNWEFTELQTERERAEAYLQARLKKTKKPVSQMGTDERAKIKSALKSVRNFEDLSGSSFDIARERISRYGSADYDMRKAIQYKKNYLKMLKDFKDFDGYSKLRRAINKTNPLKLYDDIKASELGGYLKDIRYMYDTTQEEELFNGLLDIFEIDIEEGE